MFLFAYVFSMVVHCLHSFALVTSLHMHGDVLSRKTASTWQFRQRFNINDNSVKGGVYCVTTHWLLDHQRQGAFTKWGLIEVYLWLVSV